MRTITFEDADRHLTWRAVAEAIRKGHSLPRAVIDDSLIQEGNRSLLTRAAWIKGLGIAVKSMSVYPDNNRADMEEPSIQGGMMLFDDDRGFIKAVIDGVLATKWKTAGDSGLGALLLAPPEPKTLLIIGSGTVAASLCETYQELFPGLENVHVWSRTLKNAEALAAARQAAGQELTVETDLAAACAKADIITSATMAVEPFLKGDWIKPGTHVDLIGAYRPDMREADDALIQKAELFVDSRETTLAHIGELKIPLATGVISPGDVLGDFYDLCAGNIGRSSADSITVFKNGGGAHLDLMVGDLIYRTVT